MALLDPPVSLLWWEKTIEYMFVRDMLPKSSLAVPLAGAVESAFGDMIFADSTQCRLIEFKARQDGIQREKRKFPQLRTDELEGLAFQLALFTIHAELVEHPGARAHWFVFGEHEGREVVLKTQSYTRDWVRPQLVKGAVSLEGASPRVLADYMLHLAAARGREEVVSGGGGGMVYCAVANGAIVPMQAEEFLSSACQELDLSMDALNNGPEEAKPPTATNSPQP